MKKYIFWNTLFQIVSLVLNMLSGFFLTPLYLKYISAELYGEWLISGSIVVWISILDPELSAILRQRVSEFFGNKKIKELGTLISSGLIIPLLLLLLMLAVGFLFSFFAVEFFYDFNPSHKSQIKLAMYYTIAGTSIAVFSYSVTSINQALLSKFGTNLISICVQTLVIISTIVLLKRGFGLLSLAIPWLFRGIGLLFGNLFYLSYRIKRGKIPLIFDKKNIITLLKLFSLNFVNVFCNIAINNSENIIYAKAFGSETLTSYSLSKKLSEFLRLFGERPINTSLPIFSNLLGSQNFIGLTALLENLSFYLLYFVCFSFSFMIFFNSDFMHLWLNTDKFYLGDSTNFLIAITFVLSSFNYFFFNIIFYLGDITKSNLIRIVQVISSISGLILGIMVSGMVGGMIGYCFSVFLINVLFLYFIRKKISLPFITSIRNEFFLSILLSLGIFLLVKNFIHLNSWIDLIKILTISFFLFLFFISIFSNNFKKTIRSLKNSKL